MTQAIEISTKPLTAEGFAPFGDVLEIDGEPDKIINQGKCGRYHDRIALAFGDDGRAGVSLFKSEVRSLPHTIDMMERHPDGTQAFIPMSMNPFLVIVAEDDGDKPGMPVAFVSSPGQGINFHRNVWHGVLTPLHEPGLFTVVDRIGNTPNLEEFWLEPQYVVTK
ncbi:MAG: ureidoglycolate lyase [Paracoccaceae bacterium]|nr:ureidoglycolate lyase [Paracoccaceae bacterium]MDG1739544.1 ureidoglycolate lyase [Paracoccaceae bacterium]MDG2258204.1 ureidoglycolate lyase [Paracoccaceae bacterium]